MLHTVVTRCMCCPMLGSRCLWPDSLEYQSLNPRFKFEIYDLGC